MRNAISMSVSFDRSPSALFDQEHKLVHKGRDCGDFAGQNPLHLDALENAVIHRNHEDPRKHVYVRCRCKAEEEVSITVEDEGKGFDSNALPDPAAPGAIELSHGRGTYLMKAFMDEVRFEQSRAVVHMRKKSGNSQPDPPKEVCDEGHDTRLQTFLFVWGEKSGLRLGRRNFFKNAM
jgi:hypothetical protein